ncbi:MAG: sigma-70 family RNA polymerase sigma factor [Sideroxydans sp.]|nr:sigma-70 family RNA polymerase sigma factor [Sideroxydans sp.]
MSDLNKLLGNIYALHFDELSRYLSRRTGAAEVASDMTQEVFARMVEQRASVEEIRHPRGYLFRAAKNMLVDNWRGGEGLAVELNEEAVCEMEDSPESILQRRETLAQLQAVIEDLPPRCKEVFLLHRFEDMSYIEIAERLDITVSAVEKQIMRAMKACRAALGEKKGRHN